MRRSVLELEPRPSALCTLLFLTQITATTSIYINNNYNVQLRTSNSSNGNGQEQPEHNNGTPAR